jgi:hypothetical protein
MQFTLQAASPETFGYTLELQRRLNLSVRLDSLVL